MNRFPRVSGVRPGYDPDEVDHLIKRIEATLGKGVLESEPVTADELRAARFRVRLGGYNEMAVDYALEAFIIAVENKDVPPRWATPAPGGGTPEAATGVTPPDITRPDATPAVINGSAGPAPSRYADAVPGASGVGTPQDPIANGGPMSAVATTPADALSAGGGGDRAAAVSPGVADALVTRPSADGTVTTADGAVTRTAPADGTAPGIVTGDGTAAPTASDGMVTGTVSSDGTASDGAITGAATAAGAASGIVTGDDTAATASGGAVTGAAASAGAAPGIVTGDDTATRASGGAVTGSATSAGTAPGIVTGDDTATRASGGAVTGSAASAGAAPGIVTGDDTAATASGGAVTGAAASAGTAPGIVTGDDTATTVSGGAVTGVAASAGTAPGVVTTGGEAADAKTSDPADTAASEAARSGDPAAGREADVPAEEWFEEQAARVEKVGFRSGRLGMGYNEDEVDAFLDRVVATLRRTTDAPLTPEDVRDAKFSTVLLRPGYAIGEVDEFLAELAEVIAKRVPQPVEGD